MFQLKNRLRIALALAAAVMLLAGAVPLTGFGEKTVTSTESLEIVSSYPYTTTTKVKVNLRASRSTRSALLKHIPAGATITVNAVKGSWATVEYGKYSGYVKTDYIKLKEVKKIKVTPTPSPAPTLSPEEDAGGYQVLQKGDSGSAVTALQGALIELGFLTGTPDGKFGPGTEKAVIAFQQANDYPATGVMDANIQAFLFSDKPKNAKGEKTKVKTLSPVAGVSMQKGNTGEEVTALQNRLIELGYMKGPASGTYDTTTIGAIRSFQKKNGLKSNGTANAETREKLFAEDALGYSATPTPKITATPAPTPTIAVPEVSLRSGDTGTDVKTVQKQLKKLGYYKGTIDGKYGKTTVNAVKAFQEANGLTADGVAGQATYALLFSENVLAKGTTPTPLPEGNRESSGTWTTMRRYDSGENVAQLQESLITLGFLAGPADGNYGEKTVAAVKAFQRANGLKVDGTAGAETQQLLFGGTAKSATVAATPTPTPKATATPAPEKTDTLKQGSKGTAVKELQQKLIKQGYLSGNADGVYGPKTVAAVKAFQKANNLKADGVAGAKTLSSLNGSPEATATPAPATTTASTTQVKTVGGVQYANWYDKVKAVARKYPYATVTDIGTGISWQVHIFSVGAHADYEPVTANDTAKMLKVFGGNTWNPRAVKVKFSDGSVYIGSTHSMPHDVQHIRDNNFEGHSCLHFPRTQAQVEAIGSYATKHQAVIDAAWAKIQ